MSVKAPEPPEEDPEAKRLREQAEARAESTRITERQETVSDATQSLLRRFGSKANSGTSGAAAGVNPFNFGSGGFNFTGFNPGSFSGSSAPSVFRRSSGGSGGGGGSLTGGLQFLQ